MSWLQKLKQGLSKSSQKVSDSLKSLGSLSPLVGASKLDASSLEEVEDALIGADLGTASAARLAEAMRKYKLDGPVTANSLAEALATAIAEILQPVARPIVPDSANQPHVLLLVGVNGSGKTTTAGKLARQWQKQGKKVMLAAGDTFRAAAIEQLAGWGVRTDTPVISGARGGDAAALAFQAIEQAQRQKIDVLIIDTAGRLQNRLELMDELSKILRVIKKLDDSFPHEVALVLDGNIGQNSIQQAEVFKEICNINNIIITSIFNIAIEERLLPVGTENVFKGQAKKHSPGRLPKPEFHEWEFYEQYHNDPLFNIFWYHGLRLGEGAGLLPEDIKIDARIPHFIIRDNPIRLLKNDASPRLVPIHKNCMEIASNTDLFPFSRATRCGNKWSYEFGLKLGLPKGEAQKTLRHSWRTRAGRARIGWHFQVAIMGHVISGHTADYGELLLEDINDELQKIR